MDCRVGVKYRCENLLYNKVNPYKRVAMKILRFIFLLLCLLFAISPAVAQDSENVGWPVEERCVREASKPPDGWTFPGAILMTGHYGIHAVSADVATPYVV